MKFRRPGDNNVLKIASLASWISGIGFGIPCIYGILNMLKGRGIAYVMGFPSYGHGPFEKIGINTTVSLLAGFLIVCLMECIIGLMLWNNNKGGAVLALAIIPLELVYFIGFALPFGPPLLIIRTLLLFLGWSALNQ